MTEIRFSLTFVIYHQLAGRYKSGGFFVYEKDNLRCNLYATTVMPVCPARDSDVKIFVYEKRKAASAQPGGMITEEPRTNEKIGPYKFALTKKRIAQ